MAVGVRRILRSLIEVIGNVYEKMFLLLLTLHIDHGQADVPFHCHRENCFIGFYQISVMKQEFGYNASRDDCNISDNARNYGHDNERSDG